jgi:hypothetical protein
VVLVNDRAVFEPLFGRALVGVSDYIDRKSPVKNSLFLVGGSPFEEHRKISGRSPPAAARFGWPSQCGKSSLLGLVILVLPIYVVHSSSRLFQRTSFHSVSSIADDLRTGHGTPQE